MKNCIKCDHPMRSQTVSASKHPGTRAHAAKGVCNPCYQATRSNSLRPRIDHITARPTLDQLFAERFAFEAARRARGVPPEGVLFGRYADEDA